MTSIPNIGLAHITGIEATCVFTCNHHAQMHHFRCNQSGELGCTNIAGLA